jgi:farnesyl diphosphate synthase
VGPPGDRYYGSQRGLHPQLFRLSPLRRYFAEHPAYIDLVQLFQESSFFVEIGQSADIELSCSFSPDTSSNTQGAQSDRGNLEPTTRFASVTAERYDFTAMHKTGHAFVLAAQLPVVLLDFGTPKNMKQVTEICLEFGIFFQVQNDFLDAFPDKAAPTGVGTDIQEGKCSWLLIQALERCSADQHKVLENEYGTRDEETVQRILSIYRDLSLDKVYSDYEAAVIVRLRGMIEWVDESEGLKRVMFEEFPGT